MDLILFLFVGLVVAVVAAIGIACDVRDFRNRQAARSSKGVPAGCFVALAVFVLIAAFCLSAGIRWLTDLNYIDGGAYHPVSKEDKRAYVIADWLPWIGLVGALVLGCIALQRHRQRGEFLEGPPRCSRCGYDVRVASDGRCPECGQPLIL